MWHCAESANLSESGIGLNAGAEELTLQGVGWVEEGGLRGVWVEVGAGELTVLG